MPRATSRPFVSFLRALGSLLPQWTRRRTQFRQLVRPWREDSLHSYPTAGLTPSKLRSYLQAADSGSPQMQFELFSEMLQKWPRLKAVENTRRLALTGLDWDVLPARSAAARDSTAGLAQPAADFCRETLLALERFPEALTHLADAIGYGLAVAELVWDRSRLVDVVPVPYSRLIADAHEPWRLRVLTEEEPTSGVALDEQPVKWIVHRPRHKAGRDFEAGLLRASVVLYLAQNLSFKDWLIYSQIAGMPIRVAQFEPGTPDSDQQALLKMLESLGTDAVAAFGKNIDLKFVEPARGGARPYQPLQEYCNREVTILWLGQHLTTDVGASGSRAAAEIHDRVREDLLVNDIAQEGHTLGRDLLTPLVRARFGANAPIPVFRRSLIQSVDTRVLADVLAVAVNQLGLAIPTRWVHQSLGIPEPADDEPALSTRNQS